MENPFRLYLIWTKKKLPRLDGDEIGTAYSVPPRMGLEYSLNQLCRANVPLDEIPSPVRDKMEKFGQVEKEAGPPFGYPL